MLIKHQLTANVKLLQKAVIRRVGKFGSEVLILKRSAASKSRPACWDLPGGNSEWPKQNQESAANLHLADLKREIFEETALNVNLKDLSLDKLLHFSTYFDSDKQIYTIIAAWLVDYTDTDQASITISSEHQAAAWIKATDLNNYDFGGAKGSFIVEMLNQAFAKS